MRPAPSWQPTSDMACTAHRALIYDGADEFVSGVSTFVREGLARGERVLAAATPPKIAALREALGPQAASLEVQDAGRVYARHGRMFRHFLAYVARHGDPGHGGVRIVAEQELSDREPADVRAYLRYEAAMNVALDDAHVTVLCPYDASLPDAVLADVHSTHPEVVVAGRPQPSQAFTDPRAFIARDPSLRELPADAASWQVETVDDVSAARRGAYAVAASAGVAEDDIDDLLIAVTEVVTNALRHGGPPRRFSAHAVEGTIVCRMHDGGHGPADPLAGYLPPDLATFSGRGMWLARQL